MEVVFQFVAVQIVMSVEVQGCLLLGAEDIVQPRQTDLPIEHLEHGVGIHPAAFAAADVVDVAPEGFVQRAVMEE